MSQVKSLRTGIKFKDTPIGKIPVDWEAGPFSAIAEINPKRDLTKGNQYPFVEMAAISPDSHKVKYSTLRRYKGGGARFQNRDTIFARITPCTENGKTAYIDFLKNNDIGFGSTEFIILGPKNNTDTKFVYYCAKWDRVRNIAISKMEGTSGRQRVPSRVFSEDIYVPLPPLSEQKKIAEILTTADNAIEKTDRIIEKTKELKKGLMQKLLTHGIGHKKFKKTEIGEIPVEWEIVKLIDISKINPEQIGNSYPKNYQIKYLDIAGITQADYINEIKDFTFEEAPSRARRVAQKNDILVSTVRPYLRAFARLKTCPDNLIVSTGYAVIRPKNPEDSEYIYQNILDDRFIKFLLPHMTGTNYPAVRPNDIGNYLIALPPENERKEIADILTTIDLEIDSEEINKQNLETLKKSLMHVLLTGRVRVKLQ